MSTREDQLRRVRAAIAKIAQGPKGVTFDEIEWVIARLRDLGHRVRVTGGNQHFTYRIDDLPPFQVCSHNAGRQHVKVGYVRAFLDRMIELEYL